MGICSKSTFPSKDPFSNIYIHVNFSATFGVDAKVETLCCVPEYVIPTDKCSIKILKIAKISCRLFLLKQNR